MFDLFSGLLPIGSIMEPKSSTSARTEKGGNSEAIVMAPSKATLRTTVPKMAGNRVKATARGLGSDSSSSFRSGQAQGRRW